jgi:NAD(P) transhydrogenase subunit beta
VDASALRDLAYLVSAVLFIRGMKGMTHPRTAVNGNLLSAVGMLLAILVTLTAGGIDYWIILAGLLVGGAIGAMLAVRVPMTGMPEMVALLNGLGGGASTCVAWAELINPQTTYDAVGLTAIGATGLIGTVTFTGSLIAWAKLRELKAFKKPFALPANTVFNGLFFLACAVLTVFMAVTDQTDAALLAFAIIIAIAAIMGVTLTSPIGGADMPVVIALLNSYSGLAAAAAGFIIANSVLIITGSLVGASGVILTAIMCKAMNRPLTNVLFGKIEVGSSAKADDVYAGKVKSTSADEIAMMLDGAQRCVIIPGYGMAVAQAQSAVFDLYTLLESRGVNVQFAIHPVAGRMPGHMNVLLAEVNVPYEKLVEMDQINPEMGQVDVAIVLGANDVVNPVTREPQSPIAGMPIIDADKARTVIIVKRSLSPGFAGIPNPLFAADNALMYFNDGKKAVMDIVNAVKSNA